MTDIALTDGHIVGIAGPVIDAEFPIGDLPQINTALEFDVVIDGNEVTIVAEVAQQIGDSRVRAIAMKPPTASPVAQRCATPARASACRSVTPPWVTCSA